MREGGTMLSRRQLLIGGCCIVASTSGGICECEAQVSKPFICSTVDESQVGSFEASPAVADNQSFEIGRRNDAFNLTPFGTSLIRDRWLLSDGFSPNSGKIILRVQVINGTASQRSQAAAAASAWTSTKVGNLIEFAFDTTSDHAELRILFGGGLGNKSSVGRNCLSVPKSEPTMTIEDAVDYVMLHEFGHALGLQHEHQFPKNTIEWNKDAVIAAMRAQGWSKEKVEKNIFERMPVDAICVGNPKLNEESIMLYPIPRSWTLNGFSSGVNTRISDGDVACLAGIYNIK
jgi:hypothetical protein